jgi:ABC-2 type transport system ATP-binding protein
MALINDPTLIFLDEPTSGLDVQSSRMIREILQEFPKEDKSIFLTTHNMDDANRLCDRVAIINHGKIVAIDRPSKLKNIIKRLKSVEISFDKNITTKSLSEISHITEVRKEGDKFIITSDDINGFIKMFGEELINAYCRRFFTMAMVPFLVHISITSNCLWCNTDKKGNNRTS